MSNKLIKGGDVGFLHKLYCFFFGWLDTNTCHIERKISRIFDEKRFEFIGGKRKNKTVKRRK
jgi:hypothetical protein